MENSKLDKIEEKLEKMEESLSSIDKTLIKQNAELEKHIMRTEINEQMMRTLQDEFKPIRKHVIMLETVFKVIGITGSIMVFILGCLKLAHSLGLF